MIALTIIQLTMQTKIDQHNTRIKINIFKNEMLDHGHKNRMLRIRPFTGSQWSSENTWSTKITSLEIIKKCGPFHH